LTRATLLRTTLLLLVLFVGADLFGRSTPQYKVARAVLSSEQVTAETGEIDYYLNTAFRVTGVPWRTSHFSFYVLGTKRSGWLSVEVVNREAGTAVDRIVFGDKQLLASP
jgi:hypothetical protein